MDRDDSRAEPEVILSTRVAFVGLYKFSNCQEDSINDNRNARLSDTSNEDKRRYYRILDDPNIPANRALYFNPYINNFSQTSH